VDVGAVGILYSCLRFRDLSHVQEMKQKRTVEEQYLEISLYIAPVGGANGAYLCRYSHLMSNAKPNDLSCFLPKTLSLQMLSIQLTPAIISQSLCSLLGSNVPLWLSHKLISDQELPDCRTAEKRRVEMHVEM